MGKADLRMGVFPPSCHRNSHGGDGGQGLDFGLDYNVAKSTALCHLDHYWVS